MYANHCKLRHAEKLDLMKYVVSGTAANWASIHRNTAAWFFHKSPEKTPLKQQNRGENCVEKLSLIIVFWRKVEKKTWPERRWKSRFFWSFEAWCKGHTEIILDAKSDILMPITLKKIAPCSIIYTQLNYELHKFFTII